MNFSSCFCKRYRKALQEPLKMYVRSHRKERYRSLQYALQEIWIFLMNGTCGELEEAGGKGERDDKDRKELE